MTKRNKKIWLFAIIAVVLAIIISVILLSNNSSYNENIGNMKEVNFNLGNNLLVTHIGSYTGPYMEDASDEEVSDVMMIMVTNTGGNSLQYAEITLPGKDGDALFKLSTLNSNQTVVVLETERKPYNSGDKYTEATAQNVVFFSEELNTYENVFEIQPLDGGFNITNISDEDITGEIVVYFKDCIDDLLYGGITYRGRIENGLKSGEVRQIMTNNFSQTNTKVMFVTIEEK